MTTTEPASIYWVRIRFTGGAGWIDARITAEDLNHLADQELPSFRDAEKGDIITFNWANVAAIQAEPITPLLENVV